MKMPNKEMEVNAVVVHSAQTTAYGLGLIYHIRRKKWVNAGICAIGIGYHLWSVVRHKETLCTSQSRDQKD